jgi:hypothetical protein
MKITYESSPVKEIEKDANALRSKILTVCATKVCEIAEVNIAENGLHEKLGIEGYGDNLGTVKTWFKSRVGDRDVLSMQIELDDVASQLINELKKVTTANEQGDIQCWD